MAVLQNVARLAYEFRIAVVVGAVEEVGAVDGIPVDLAHALVALPKMAVILVVCLISVPKRVVLPVFKIVAAPRIGRIVV